MFSRPRTVADALALLATPNAVVLSGGTDFYPQRLNRSHAGVSPEHIVDLTAIDELRGVSETATGWRIGATTTWTRIAEADLPTMFDGLRSAARQVGGAQIQNVGTVAGNLCTASPAADGVPPLLTLDAVIELQSLSGTRHVPLADFITSYRLTALQPGELVVALGIPAVAGFMPDSAPDNGWPAVDPAAGSTTSTTGGDVRSSFVKLGSRAYLVISIAMVAVLVAIENGSITRARVAVGSCSPVARRLPLLESALVGVPIDEVAAIDQVVRTAEPEGLAPIDDVRASGDYRSTVVPRLIVDALAGCRTPLSIGQRS